MDTRTAGAAPSLEDEFRLLVDGVRDYAIFKIDPQGFVETWNSGAERIKGYRAPEILGRHFSVFYTESDRVAGLPGKALAAAVRNGRHEMTGQRVRKDGSRFWADVMITALHDTGGRLRGFAKVTRDVTERIQREREMAATRRRLELILNSAGEGICGIDRSGATIFVNRAAERMTGWSAREMIGRDHHALIHHSRADGEPLPPEQCPIHGSLLDGVQRSARRTVFWRKDGTQFPVFYTASPVVDEDGSITGTVVLFSNATAHQAAEEALRRRSAELEAANHELEAFAYSVSHDLRAPLRALDGFSQALQEDCAETLDARCLGFLSRIRAATVRMGELIDDLLALSRVTRSPMAYSEIDVTELARSILAEDLAECFDPQRTTVTVQPGLRCIGDEKLLRIALRNLLDNALKFSRNTERPVIEVGVSREGGRAALYVRDNGAGFDPRYAEKLFTPFQRLHGQSEFEGTGIGLAIVQRIVHRHGGDIRAVSSPGRGATIVLSLEADADAPESTPDAGLAP